MKRLNPWLFILVGGLGAWLLLTVVYSLWGEYRLTVGELGDGPYVSGFNGDEAGAPRYRWTGSPRLKKDAPAVGIVTLPLTLASNGNNRVQIALRAAGESPVVTVTVNGIVVGTPRADVGVFKTVELSIPAAAADGDQTRIEISSKAFKPETDSRYLGVQVAEVRLLTGAGLRRPPLEAVFWAWLYITALGLILLQVAGRDRLYWSAGAGVAGLLPWLLLPFAMPPNLNLWYTPFFLPILGVSMAGVALLTWRNEAGEWLGRFLDRLEQEEKLSRNILVGALALYTLYALIIVARMDYIGHADYADNAVAARNIVQGRGYSLDYAAQFYQAYQLPRPADTWPPLQPFLIVPFYAVFGPTVWAAKLPNLLLLPALSWAIYYYGSRLFNRRAGLGAALLVPIAVVPAFSSAPAFFETIAYPINDLGFTLLAFLLLATISTAIRPANSLTLSQSQQTPLLPHPAEDTSEVAPNQINPTPDSTQPIVDFDEQDLFKALPELKPSAKIIDEAEPAIPPQTEAATAPQSEAEALTSNPPSHPSSLILHPSSLTWIWAGIWSGLLFLSKPSGAVILVVAGLWVLGRKYIGRNRPWLPWQNLLIWGGIALLVVTPFLARNVLQFGTLYRSTEQYDAWVTKWNPPDERIYDLYKPFSERESPQPRQLLEYGWDAALNAINNQFKKFFSNLLEGQLFPPLLLMLVAVGLTILPRRRYGLASLLGLGLLIYILLFNILWHYEPRYFLVWVPWIYLFGLYGLSKLCDRITSSRFRQEAARTVAQSSKAGYWLVGVAFLILALPGVSALLQEGPSYATPTGIVTTAEWIKQNTPPEAVIMSRNVWELSFHSERQSVMTPNNASLNQVKSIMRQYRVRYVQLDHLEDDDRTVNRQWGQRAAFWPLLDRQGGKAKNYEGFKLVYDKGGLLVYQWDGN